MFADSFPNFAVLLAAALWLLMQLDILKSKDWLDP